MSSISPKINQSTILTISAPEEEKKELLLSQPTSEDCTSAVQADSIGEMQELLGITKDEGATSNAFKTVGGVLKWAAQTYTKSKQLRGLQNKLESTKSKLDNKKQEMQDFLEESRLNNYPDGYKETHSKIRMEISVLDWEWKTISEALTKLQFQ